MIDDQIREAMDREDWRTVNLLIPLIDALDQHRTPGLLSSALWYAEAGLAVFPLSPGTKIPFKGSGGLRDATTDHDRIRAWWGRVPRANVAIATGGVIDVIDVDGAEGVVSWARADFGRVCGTVSTPRPGGSHLYIPADPDRRNGASVLPGIDVRASGGYVVAPPSVITDGPHPGGYRWRRPLDLRS